MDEKSAGQLLQQHADALSEHFESVQIFATLRDTEIKEPETSSYSLGNGNWYSRFGQVSLWVEHQKERTRDEARRREDSEDEE